ncbi:CopG family transcriptional regulator [Brachybacterium sp. JHP9]|uniref:CopG family transcriptional regulator n=1 Tax=Brachybacterium equifaecis TaxID=2910770 RepID=A0ABT0QY42_9MICO|nr:CopG family transcriptional regulator [Brachybacterium equifaecis]MCL6422597.1 CopG family transcriptional regulator [Brachybacterium equifaecis]
MAKTVRLTDEDWRAPASLAEAGGATTEETAVRASRQVAEPRTHSRAVSEASARVRARYADVLDRLGR